MNLVAVFIGLHNRIEIGKKEPGTRHSLIKIMNHLFEYDSSWKNVSIRIEFIFDPINISYLFLF